MPARKRAARKPKPPKTLDLTSHQVKYLALGDASGKDMKLIAKSVDLPVRDVKRVLGGELLCVSDRKSFRAIRRASLARRHASDVRHRAKMDALADAAYATIERAVGSFDNFPDLATKTAWQVLNNTGVDVQPVHGAADGGDGGGTVNAQVNFMGGPQAGEAILTVMKGISAATEGMTPLDPIGSPSKHIRVSEAEVVSSSPPASLPPESEEADVG